MLLGDRVRDVDIKEPEYEASPAGEFLQLDLRALEHCEDSWRTLTTSTPWLPISAASDT